MPNVLDIAKQALREYKALARRGETAGTNNDFNEITLPLAQHKPEVPTCISAAGATVCRCDPVPGPAGCGPTWQPCLACGYTWSCGICGGCRNCKCLPVRKRAERFPGKCCTCPDTGDLPLSVEDLPACPGCGQRVFWCSACQGCRLCRE